MLMMTSSRKNRETKLYMPQNYQNMFTEGKNSCWGKKKNSKTFIPVVWGSGARCNLSAFPWFVSVLLTKFLKNTHVCAVRQQPTPRQEAACPPTALPQATVIWGLRMSATPLHLRVSTPSSSPGNSGLTATSHLIQADKADLKSLRTAPVTAPLPPP